MPQKPFIYDLWGKWGNCGARSAFSKIAACGKGYSCVWRLAGRWKTCFKARDNEEFCEKIRNIVENNVENLDEVTEQAYNIAKERNLINIGKNIRNIMSIYWIKKTNNFCIWKFQ